MHRLRCMGHIINLSIQSFMWNTDTEDLEEPENQTTNDEDAIITEWRKKGPLGMLHNLVVHIQLSPQRLQQFEKLANGRRPVRDNKTRWLSWSTMLNANTKPPIRDAFASYLRLHQKEYIQKDKLSANDWVLLQKICEFLEYVRRLLLELEGHSATLNLVLPAMDMILAHYQKWMEDYAGHIHLEPMLKAGWRKMNKYLKLTSDTPAYIAAIVLDPALKFEYIDINWTPEDAALSKDMMRKFWQDHYRPTAPIASSAAQSPANDGHFHGVLWQRRQHQQQRVSNIADEYEHYIQQDTVYEEDALQWWVQPLQQAKYPNLSKMAIDILSIPAMADETERIFSHAKQRFTALRTLLGMRTFRAFECLKSWYKLKPFDLNGVLLDGEELQELLEANVAQLQQVD